MLPALVDSPLTQARAALRRGDAPAARRLLEPLLETADEPPFDAPTDRLPADAAVPGAGPAEIETCIELGNALEQLGEYAGAMQRFVRADDAARLAHLPALRARALLGMARVEHALGDEQGAAARLDEGTALAAQLDDDGLAGELLHQLGMTLSRLERHEEAERCYERALAHRERAGNAAALGVTCNSLGVLHLHRGNREPEGSSTAAAAYATARRHFEAALLQARAGADQHLEALAHGNIGTVAGSVGDLDEALARFLQQLAALRRMGDRQNEALALANIGEAHRRAGAHDAALAALHESLALGVALDSLPRQRRAHAELSVTFEAMGDFAPALQHHKRFHALDRRIRSDEAELQATKVTARLAVEQVRREAEAYRSERDRLRGDNERLSQAALTDALTGLGNRRQFDEWMNLVLRAEPRDGALALLDIDHFKRINDQHGHAVGDRVLADLGPMLQAALRPADRAFRLGGEEFGIWLADASAEAATAVCERLRQRLAAAAWGELAAGLVVTASFGVSVVQPTDATATLAARADAALYAAKRGGRDQVVVG